MSRSYSNGLKSCLFVCFFVVSYPSLPFPFPSPVPYSLNVTFASFSHGAKKLVGQKRNLGGGWSSKWAYPILSTLISSFLSSLSTFLFFVSFPPSFPFNTQNLQPPPTSLHSTMSNKPSAKAIARLNATTLFPEIKKGTLMFHSHTRNWLSNGTKADTQLTRAIFLVSFYHGLHLEIEKNPSLFAIRGFFIFNVTKKGVPMTEW